MKIYEEEEDEYEDLYKAKQELERRRKELERRRKELARFVKNIKLGLREINKAFKNKEWESEEEKLFLESFYNCRAKYGLEKYPNYIFIKKNDKIIAYQDLKNKQFKIDYFSIWEVFKYKFYSKIDKNKSFMEIMLNKYFKLKDYTPLPLYPDAVVLLNEHFKLN